MSITFRLLKGQPLNHTEADNNFRYKWKWKENTEYKVGMVVTYQYNFYECISQHTSTISFDPSKFNVFGAVSGSSGGGIQYFWNDAIEQTNQVGTSVGERGVRLDLFGRPVYEWNGAAWQVVVDATTTNQYYLDGPLGNRNVIIPNETMVIDENKDLVFGSNLYNKGTINIVGGSGNNDFGLGNPIPTYGTLRVDGVIINEGLIVNNGLLIS